MTRRLVLLATVTLATALTAWWIVGALVGWSIGRWLAPLPFVVNESTAAVFNLAALAVFMARRAAWVLVVAQIANVLFSVVAAVVFNPIWLLFAAPVLLTLVLALVLRRMDSNKTGAAA